jgi:CBS domain-containing protein
MARCVRLAAQEHSADVRAIGAVEMHMRASRRVRSKTFDWAVARDYRPLDEPELRVESVMSKAVATCRADDSLNTAAQLMWDRDCGCVPVVGADSRVIGMVTDRDVCMAAYTQGKTLREIQVGSICSRQVYTCHRDEPLPEVAELMVRAQVRRLPVVDLDETLVGIVSLSDLTRHASSCRSSIRNVLIQQLASVFEAVSRPRAQPHAFLEPPSTDEKEYLARFDTP